MNRIVMAGLLASLALVGCQTTNPTTQSAAAGDFDGSWKGARIDVTGSSICQPTQISGTITNGQVALKLLYNGTSLTGNLNDQGEVTLDSSHATWDYRFSGKAVGNRLEGSWSIGNAVCHGTWYVERE